MFVFVTFKERLGQLQDAQKENDVTSEATERELELEAQLVEARSIIQEQVERLQQLLPIHGDLQITLVLHGSCY